MSSHTPRRRSSYKPPLEVDVHVGDWGSKGYVQADIEGRVVAVDRAIPGELVHVKVVRHRRPWHGIVQDVHEPSPDRVAPPCPAYLVGCGGCQWQHLSYAAQLDAKRNSADGEMSRAGLDLNVSHVHAMDIPWRYRRTASIALGWEAGFRPRGRRGIVEIHDCPISDPLIGYLADQLNVVLKSHDLPSYHGKIWLDCTVVNGSDSPGLQVVIQGIEGLTLETHPELPEVAAQIRALNGVISVAYRHRSGSVVPLEGDLEHAINVAGEPLWQPAGAFAQTNGLMLDRLIERMRAAIHLRSPQNVADVYGGSGTFALAFASMVRHMTLIELDVSAVAAARRTATDRGLANVTCVSDHAERALADVRDLDAIIVDPPRSGLGPVTIEALAHTSATEILYVSCSPVSLALDVAALQERGFQAHSLELFDFYPQTYHVESFVILDRAP